MKQENEISSDEEKQLSPIQLYMQSWRELINAPSDLWLIFTIKFLDLHIGSAIISTLLIYLSDVKDVSDSNLIFLFIIFGVSGCVFVVLLGSFPDRFGVKACLIVGNLLHICEFGLLIFVKELYIQIVIVLIFGALPGSLLAPALDSSIKHYSGKHFRTLAVSCYSTISVTASLLGGVLIEIMFSVGSKDESTFTLLFIYSCFISIIALIVSLFVKNTDYSYFSLSSNADPKINKESGLKHTKEVLVLKNFWRFLMLNLLTVLTRTISFQTVIMLPLYMDRDFGSDTNYGLTVIANQLVIILTLPFSGYTYYFLKPYSIFIIVGGILCIAPLIFLFGASYFAIFFFVCMVAIGDSLNSARFLEYVYEVAPKGKESVIIAIGSTPFSIGVIAAGISGGVLMNEYCPDHGDRECWKAWLAIILIALPAFVCMIVFRKWIENRPNEQDPYVACCIEGREENSKES